MKRVAPLPQTIKTRTRPWWTAAAVVLVIVAVAWYERTYRSDGDERPTSTRSASAHKRTAEPAQPSSGTTPATLTPPKPGELAG